MFKRKKKIVDEVNSNPSNAKVIRYSYKDIFKNRLKEISAMLIMAFLWMLRLAFIPSILISGTTLFSTNIIPSIAAQIYNYTGLTEESLMVDQFAFFYLPMFSFVFIFGTVVAIGVCFVQYRFWKKCGVWIKYWYGKTGIRNPFKRDAK